MQEINISPYAIPGIIRIGIRTSEIIIRAVCDYYFIEKEDLTFKCNKREYATPRHIAMYLIKTQTSEKLLHIGRRFNRDHTTVIHAMNKINGFLHIKDNATIQAIETISNNIKTYN